jgi:hypothetical protein
MMSTPAKSAATRVFEQNGRLVCQHLADNGTVDGWIELPSSLKQPLMALVAEVGDGKRPESEFPVPGGDRLVVKRLADGGLRLERLPLGFPPEGRELDVPTTALSLFLSQVRAV